jgi:hypothetical protein
MSYHLYFLQAFQQHPMQASAAVDDGQMPASGLRHASDTADMQQQYQC